MPGPQPGAPLSPREAQVLALVAEGLGNAAIGRRLYLTEDSVKTVVSHLFIKLGALNRAHAVGLACAAGLLKSTPQKEEHS